MESKVFNDVSADALRGRSGECHYRHFGKDVAELRDLAKLRPKIVPPFRYAMRLVDRERRDVPASEILLPLGQHQTLGSDVEEAKFVAM